MVIADGEEKNKRNIKEKRNEGEKLKYDADIAAFKLTNDISEMCFLVNGSIRHFRNCVNYNRR